MKSILQPIKPQYCELIASGKKTVEVRKTRPKLDVPFKVYIYCTRGKLALLRDDRDTEEKYKFDYWDFVEFHKSNGMEVLGGKVIGEYVCDEISEYKPITDGRFNGYNIFLPDLICTCLSDAEIPYYGKGKVLYGWHISDLKIYDKPKELNEFGKECNLDCPSVHCPYWKYQRVNADEWDYDCSCNNIRPLTRPPQSWCYVEEV